MARYVCDWLGMRNGASSFSVDWRLNAIEFHYDT
jgi:hypothetical protein